MNCQVDQLSRLARETEAFAASTSGDAAHRYDAPRAPAPTA